MRARHQYLYQGVVSQRVNQSWDQTRHHSLIRSQDQNLNRLLNKMTLKCRTEVNAS